MFEENENNINTTTEENTSTETNKGENEVKPNPELGVPQWYVANSYSGREKIVKEYIETRRVSMGLENEIFRVIVPEKEVNVIDKKTNRPIIKKNGEPRTKIVNLYPGYIFVEAIMTDRTWYVIRNTPGVTGIVGSSGSGTKPFPIPREDMIPVLKAANIPTDEVIRTDYNVGETVKIVEGPFEDEIGEITAVNPETSSLSVNVTFFGRPTTISVNFQQVEKIEKIY